MLCGYQVAPVGLVGVPVLAVVVSVVRVPVLVVRRAVRVGVIGVPVLVTVAADLLDDEDH